MKKLIKSVFRSVRVKFALNLVYALYNGAVGIVTGSMWFITIGAYYIILSIMRFLIVVYKTKNRETENFIMRFSGFMFIVLSLILAGTLYMTLNFDVSHRYHEIIMITIALYAFTKVTFAVIRYVKSRRDKTPLKTTVCNISIADAGVSLFSLQSSMLVSFDGMSSGDIYTLNMLTGIGICVIVVILGINMIIRKDMK